MNTGQSDDTRDRLIAILTSPKHMSLQLAGAEIHDETSLISDLGLDSIQVLEFCTAIEDELKIDIAESIQHSTLHRFADLVSLVRDARAADALTVSATKD
jgi:acyl carrier protein